MPDKKPKVLSIRSAENPRNGIVLYGEVKSASQKGVKYTVTKNNRGTYRCSCKPGMFNPGTACTHIEAFKEKERS